MKSVSVSSQAKRSSPLVLHEYAKWSSIRFHHGEKVWCRCQPFSLHTPYIPPLKWWYQWTSYDAYDAHLHQLQAGLNAAARLVVRKWKYDCISSTIRDILHWLPIWLWVEFKMCVLMYNCLHNISPSYLSSMCQPVSVNSSRWCLRSAARGDLVVPATKTVCYGPRSFAVAGPAMWNSLPASLRDDQLSVTAFHRLLKTELFTRAYDFSLARSWLLLTVRVGEHNFNYYYYYHLWTCLYDVHSWFLWKLVRNVTSRLRTASTYPRPTTRTKRYTSFVQHGLLHYQTE